MEGDVLSVSQDSFVVARNETFTEDGASYMVGAAPGYEDEEDKITVRVAGSWQDDGSFLADTVVMSKFV